MKDTLDFFLGLNDHHWQGSAYQWFFYAGILITLIFEKRRMVKIVFGWVPFLYLVCLFNPLSIKLLGYAGVSNAAYFVRLFSFMPLMYVIAKGFMLLMQMDNPWLKLCGTGLACVVICFFGKNIYLESWFIKAENYVKVPQSTLDILSAIDTKTDKPVCIAAIGSDPVYLRQVEDVVMPYGRYIGSLGDMLSMDPPDIQQVMELAGQQDVDYIIARRTGSTIAAFLKYRYKPFALTNDYVIFAVQGVNRVNRILNDRRQIIKEMETNPSGEVVKDRTGSYAYSYEYDTNGRVVKITFLDKDGNPTDEGRAYASIQRTYYLNGDIKTVSYFDQDGRPVMMNGRYETKYIYDKSSRVIKEVYYDQYGALMNRLDGQYTVCEFSYSPTGKINGECFLNGNNKPTRSAWGYARMDRIFNESDIPVRETYYDTDGTVLGLVGDGLPSKAECLNEFYRYTGGAQKNEGREIVFETNRKNNGFKTVCLRLYDCVTNAFIYDISIAKETGRISGEYIHSLPSGLYKLELNGYANIEDETLSSTEYLSEGEHLFYSYSLDELSGSRIKISNFYIGRENKAG